ncbi:hypothetical protein E5S69_18035 [Cupriavidus necator]|uniref:hypothetical protein n=1 Tax=Cupriavidus necator TaxID=106590 RepID=UPI001490560D|nr:hypothetical protein [Cupriavidus necator]NOV25404.1 hypothetical protein [Cupriavidus necator]
MLSRRLPTPLAAMLIAATLLCACGGGDGDGDGATLSPAAALTPALPGKPGQPGNKPDQRPEPVIRCAP